MIFYANEYIFLDRKWAADKPRMTAMLKRSQEFPYPASVSSLLPVVCYYGNKPTMNSVLLDDSTVNDFCCFICTAVQIL